MTGRRIRLTVWLVLLAGCGAAQPPQLFKQLSVTDGEGKPLPAMLRGDPSDGLEMELSFLPAHVDPTQFPERGLQPPDQWRFRLEISQPNGDRVADNAVTQWFEEFETYDALGITLKSPHGALLPTLLWTSPEAPKAPLSGGITYWGRADLPRKLGSYLLSVRLYPTADRRTKNQRFEPEWGEGFTVWTSPVEVVEAPAGEKPVIADSANLMYVTAEERKAFLLPYEALGKKAPAIR